MKDIKNSNFSFENIFENFLFILGIILFVYYIIFFNSQKLFSTILTLLTVLTANQVLKRSKVKINNLLYFFCDLFIFCSMYLGQIGGFYSRFYWWDILLHSMSGLVLAELGFQILLSLNSQYINKSLNPYLKILFAFFFAVACAGMWEIFEFSGDQLLGLNSQLNSLWDTMCDIIAGTIGALLDCSIHFLNIKK
ncbi:hypothetical protein [Hathewaya limosa]|uniref:Membrane protein YjdF n=1 Tax=Hathewaya limosa TaxID=1536 RepID=A0ABU0JRE3_HATLI|nr:hypothetical protein [Hathewaya limosa]MDQ0478629.1 putative membrane protein YjdF [Hathewaya limosa]